ncbi:uncharacterized protein LOC125880683 [Epinephelus fuscoguttatus]|uniref:uncharacterized protein LOC125880683 n=1 Tax=Epinephelus fuscoguttatus TaxID=293821 RepID=UPI0020D0F19B|nr:uncharacterized protein LOC125880683 [Epinephelus fuscoguttatus]
MMYGLCLRVSWICLLLFSSGACFPATKGDYRYPYTWSSGGGSAPGSNLQSGGSRPPLVNLQYEPSVSYQQPQAAPQQASSSTGNRSPSSVGAPSASAASSPSYGKKTPSFSVQPQSAAGTSGNVNMGSGGAASGPVYGAAPAYPAAGYMDFGDGPVPYIGAPAASSSAGSYAYGAPAASSSAGSYAYGAPAASSSAGSYAYGAPVAYNSGGGGDSSPGLPWSMQPAGGADSSFSDPSNWMPSRDFPDLSVWDSSAEMPQSMSETSPLPPLPPSSYIIQSRNGYQRAQEFLSHTKYSPEYPEPPVFAAETEAPGMSPPEAGPKGGKKV